MASTMNAIKNWFSESWFPMFVGLLFAMFWRVFIENIWLWIVVVCVTNVVIFLLIPHGFSKRTFSRRAS